MPQFARPSADSTNPGSFTDSSGGVATLYQRIDETSADDADFLQCPTSPSSAVFVFSLSAVTDPASSASHIMRWRVSKDVGSGGETIDALFELRQGYQSETTQGTLIASQAATNISTAWTTNLYTLSAAEADAITDYGALFGRIRFDVP